MKIYTKIGDKGTTRLGNGLSTNKDDPLLDVYGDIDELNSYLGLIAADFRATDKPRDVKSLLIRIQNELFYIGSETSLSNQKFDSVLEATENLESYIDYFDAMLPPLKHFILPGGTTFAAKFHVARTICRRAERHMARFANPRCTLIRIELLIYLNRLSDLLFTMARVFNRHRDDDTFPRHELPSGNGDVIWQPLTKT